MTKIEEVLIEAHQLGKVCIHNLWNELGLQKIIGPSDGRWHTTLCEDIVAFYDTELLAEKVLRDLILESGKPRLAKLRSAFGINGRRADWKKRLFPNWVRGGKKAIALCEALDFDLKYAGLRGALGVPSIEYLRPIEKATRTEPFQNDLVQQLTSALRQSPPCRLIVTLPTGAGKTKVAIEAIMQFQEEFGGIVLWIANTTEVCEQAAQSYKRVYLSDKRGFDGTIQRFWGRHNLDLDFTEGFMVAGIQRLGKFCSKKKKPTELRGAVSLVVFDEAHHAVARTYKKTLRFFTGEPEQRINPLIGLTATPSRGVDPDGKELKSLISEFPSDLVQPAVFGKKDPVRFLQNCKVLSRLKYITCKSESKIEVLEQEKEEMLKFATFPASLLGRIGELEERNATILRYISKAGSQKPTLVFACSVDQAQALAYAWRKKDIEARAITAETHFALRSKWIEDFKSGRIRALVNVGVLATGFDAPDVQRIIMARPTMSSVLFHQMVGRGLRGPKFGGTEVCDVVDIVDTFKFHGGLKGFKDFERKWLRGLRPWKKDNPPS